MKFHFSIEEAKTELQKTTSPFVLMHEHGSMKLEYYVPVVVDKQTSHQQDEIYVIASGNAIFYRGKERINCKTGDVIFVPATVEHQFKDFSKEFATWVIFYGKDGGE
jgi:mannose-6-phosphate isomerase-like protein (cupin superfamily)